MKRSRTESHHVLSALDELRAQLKLVSEHKSRKLHFWAGGRREGPRPDRPASFMSSSKFILGGHAGSDISPTSSPYMVSVLRSLS